MSSNLLTFVGWSFLPNLVTGWVQTLWYGITIRAGDPKPQPGSSRYIAHRRRIHILVVSLYLLYTIYEADWDIRRGGDFYQDLGVPYSATDKEIKSKFRRLAALHHPDKVSTSGSSFEGSDRYFVHLKTAQDTLLDPAKRFAYERFGPSIVGWERCSSVRDYLGQGVPSILAQYGMSAIVLCFFGFFGYFEFAKFWRWVVLAVVCTFELYAISRPFYPPILGKLINPVLSTFTAHPPYLPYQAITLLRKISFTAFVAFNQIGPWLQTPNTINGTPEVVLKQQLDRLEQTAAAAEVEVSRLMTMEMSPFAGDQATLKEVQGKVKEWLVQNTIRNDPEVRDAMGKVLQRRRADAPAGARGTK